jgi:hypothetical protein
MAAHGTNCVTTKLHAHTCVSLPAVAVTWWLAEASAVQQLSSNIKLALAETGGLSFLHLLSPGGWLKPVRPRRMGSNNRHTQTLLYVFAVTWWVAEASAVHAQALVAAQCNGHVGPRLGLTAAAAAAEEAEAAAACCQPEQTLSW